MEPREPQVGVRGPPPAPVEAAKAPSAPPAEEEPEELPFPLDVEALPTLGRGGAPHRYLQDTIKRWAEHRGWRVTIEKPILDGLGSVDVVLERDGETVACEVAVTTSPEQELGNVQKCLAAGYETVVTVSDQRKPLAKIRTHVQNILEKTEMDRVHFLTPEELFRFQSILDPCSHSFALIMGPP